MVNLHKKFGNTFKIKWELHYITFESLGDIKRAEWGNLWIACIYASNIFLWHIMVEFLFKDFDLLIKDDFNMTERPKDKFSDCGKVISDLEIFPWREFRHAFQVRDIFTRLGGHIFLGIKDK